MNKKQLVSIILTVYNEEKLIKKCVLSLLQQSYTNTELLVINDGSTDKSLSIINKLGIKAITIKHSGPGRARIYGASISKGNILVFVDADMIYDQRYVYNLVGPILHDKCSGTFSTAEYVANPDNIWSKCWNINIGLPINKRVTDEKNNDGKVYRAILKKKFIEFGGFDNKLGYFDDQISNYSKALPVSNALCYHFNPDNLIDVYFSARWIGRSGKFKSSLRNLLKYSMINSLRISWWRIKEGAPLLFVMFKLIFDFGILTGSINRNTSQNYSK